MTVRKDLDSKKIRKALEQERDELLGWLQAASSNRVEAMKYAVWGDLEIRSEDGSDHRLALCTSNIFKFREHSYYFRAPVAMGRLRGFYHAHPEAFEREGDELTSDTEEMHRELSGE